jgi:alpha-glucosidase
VKGKYIMKTAAHPLARGGSGASCPALRQTRTARPITISSPDGRTSAELSAADGILRYRIVVDGKQVLAPSMIGIEADDVELGQGVTLGSAKSRKMDEHYHLFGTHAEAVNHANETTVPAQPHGQSYLVDVHVANDGIGVRLRLPAKTGRTVQADRSTWMIGGDPTVWA